MSRWSLDSMAALMEHLGGVSIDWAILQFRPGKELPQKRRRCR